MSQSKVNQKSFAVSRFGLTLEQASGGSIDVTSYIKSIDGGLPKVESTKEQVGAFNQPRNHLATRTVEPITIEIGLCGGNPLLRIVEDVVNKREHNRIGGHIFHADANSKSRFEQEFTRGLITEIGLPAMDAAGKDLSILKVKIQPESATFKSGSGQMIPMGVERSQKVWQANSFRLDLECNGRHFDCTHVTKIEALTITVGAKAVQRGKFLLPEYMPTQVKMPKLSIHIALHHAGSLIDWFREVSNLEAGKKADGAAVEGGYEATGSLTYLDTTTKKDLYEIEFVGLAPEQMTIVKSEGSAATLKTCKFDFYVTNIKLKP